MTFTAGPSRTTSVAERGLSGSCCLLRLPVSVGTAPRSQMVVAPWPYRSPRARPTTNPTYGADIRRSGLERSARPKALVRKRLWSHIARP